ncbi:C40 family peptidase [Pelosinus propionicus]|nr:NlpC/P60 family protein [Pelosinus propionicus]
MTRGLLFGLLFSIMPLFAYAADNQFKEGDQGNEIAAIQMKLKEKGYKITKIDGKFSTETTKAVRNFQKRQKLKSDGIVENRTYYILMGKNLKVSNEKVQDKAKQITDTAKNYVGVPYKFGGTSPKGFDCSGFVQYVFGQKKVTLPRAADEQYKVGKAITQKELKQGDLVFFSTYEKGASHCGIYLEQGKFIHASSHGVMVSHLGESYWKTRYLGAKRII